MEFCLVMSCLLQSLEIGCQERAVQTLSVKNFQKTCMECCFFAFEVLDS